MGTFAMKKILLSFLISSLAFGGLPPTTSKDTSDSSNITTFNYQFPNFTGTHTGTTFSLGVNAIAGGGTGLSSTSQNFVFVGPASGSGAPSWRLLGSGDIPSLSSIYLPLTGGTMSGVLNMGTNQITNVVDPTTAQMAATKNYVDTQLAQLNPAQAVYAASTVNIPGTYTNVVSGVCIGDTFQTTSTTQPFVVDSATPSVGSRVLFKNQSSSFQDGVWNLTTQAVSGVSGAIFTRSLDFDSSADINAGSIVPVQNGGQAGSSWYQTATNTTCNTSTQTWTQFQNAASAYLLSANNLSDIANSSTAFYNIAQPASGSTTGVVSLGAQTLGSGIKTFSSNPAFSATSAHTVLIGEGSSSIAAISPGSTVGYALLSNGASSDPSFGPVSGSLPSQGAYTALVNATSSSAVPSGGTTITLGAPQFADTGVASQFTAPVAGYYQMILNNSSNASNASSDFIVNNNSGTASTFYGDFGMNSSTFSGAGSFQLPNAVYLFSQSGDLVVGTNTSNAVHFLAGNSTADAMGINTSNQVTIPTSIQGNIIDTSNVLNIKDSTTNTKIMAFNTSGLSTGTTLTIQPQTTTSQTLFIPNITAGDSIETLGLAQTIGGVKTFTNAPVFSSVTASQLLSVNGSKALTSNAFATAPTASTIVEFDANKNVSGNNILSGYTSTVATNTPQTLTIGSTQQQVYTGTLGQTVNLPTTSIVAGISYILTNYSTGTMTVKSSNGSTIQTVGTSNYIIVTANAATPTTVAGWNAVQGSTQFAGFSTAAASYYVSSNFAATGGSPINFDTKIYDTNNAVTTGTNWKFIAPFAGTYHVCTLIGDSGTQLNLNIYLYYNESPYKSISYTYPNYLVNPCADLHMNVGDRVFVSPSANITCDGGALGGSYTNYIDIHRTGN
jgi:hypothetical protein